MVGKRLTEQPYNPTLGTPVFLPPDPLKDPSNDANVAGIWSEFETALASATHILILGHSLNDEPLIRAIESVGPQADVAVATLGPDRKEISDALPKAKVIEIRFGPGFKSKDLSSWVQGIVELSTA